MIKDIVVPLTHTTGDPGAVEAAAAIASTRGSRLTVLEFVKVPVLPAGSWGAEYSAAALYRQHRADAEANAQGWRKRLDSGWPDLSSEVRVLDPVFADVPGVAALHARYADLAVMTMAIDPASEGAIVRSCFASVLLGSGRPVLLMPPDFAWRHVKHAVVAWQPRREASRALHDAMPFLAGADTVDLVEVGAARGPGGDGPLPGADIAAHLARHGLKVRVVALPMSGDPVADTLARHARETGADLLVCGGYGHSRMREWVMGGVTRDLVAGACPIPVFLSH